MNTARWGSMGTADREEAIHYPCECDIQNIEHVMSECEYMVVCLDAYEMVDTIEYTLQSELAHQKRFLVDRFRRCFEQVQNREDGV